LPFPYTFPFPFDAETLKLVRYKLDAALKALGVSAGYRIDVIIAALSSLSKCSDIDTLLKALSLSELHEIDVTLEKLCLSNYHNDLLLILRSHVNLALDVALQGLSAKSYGIDMFLRQVWNIPVSLGIGLYLAYPQKFDVALSFIRFSVDCTFERFEAEPSFEQFHVSPYFQEV
jgi:hypothetical protein